MDRSTTRMFVVPYTYTSTSQSIWLTFNRRRAHLEARVHHAAFFLRHHRARPARVCAEYEHSARVKSQR